MTGSQPNLRLIALRRFAVTITLFNTLGHTILGFEQSWAQPLVALITAYAVSLFLEWIFARSHKRKPPFAGGLVSLLDFLLPAHISALAVSMLIYPNERLLPLVFAVTVCISSKYIFRVPVGNGTRHFFNPSNFGIAITLLLFPWVGISPPYHFTENLVGAADWLLPLLIIVLGSSLNIQLTGKLPLILSWCIGFILQALLRHTVFGTPLVAALLPMSGVAFILFTFYMVTDPATTPRDTLGQIRFGLVVAATYGLLVTVHIVFGLFFALVIVSGLRGIGLALQAWNLRRQQARLAVQMPAVLGRSEP